MIRPLVFCEEREITGAARRLALPIVKSACPADGVTARNDTADLVKQLEKQFPHLRAKVLGPCSGPIWTAGATPHLEHLTGIYPAFCSFPGF